MSAFTNRLAAVCLHEWERWDRGNGRETQGKDKGDAKDYYLIVKDYWVSIGIRNLNGRTVQGTIRPAWSSAFVSFCVQKAGATDGSFKYAQAHCHYIDAAMKAAKLKSNNYGYWAQRNGSYVAKVGDIVCGGREYAKRYNYDEAEMAYKADSFYPSHGDIIVALEPQNRRVVAIGGNVSDNVQRKYFATDSRGCVTDRVVNGKAVPWIAVLECRL